MPFCFLCVTNNKLRPQNDYGWQSSSLPAQELSQCLQSGGSFLLLTRCVHVCGSDERIAYYNMNKIAYVARPPHGKDGFMRGGRFKKASNMNFSLTVSQQVSQVMQVRLSMAPVISALRMI